MLEDRSPLVARLAVERPSAVWLDALLSGRQADSPTVVTDAMPGRHDAGQLTQGTP
jgi:hypothetical protein